MMIKVKLNNGQARDLTGCKESDFVRLLECSIQRLAVGALGSGSVKYNYSDGLHWEVNPDTVHHSLKPKLNVILMRPGLQTTTAGWGVDWRKLATELGYTFFPDFVREFGKLTHLEKYELVTGSL